MSEPRISVVICTYNRAELLASCLESLLNQTADPALFEVLVIDNNSSDQTAETTAQFAGGKVSLRYIFEARQGLSHARNRGYQEALAPWVLYVDDDAKAAADLVERAIWFIGHHNYVMFGGVFLPWYKYGRPSWYRDQYGSNKMRYEEVAVLKGDELAFGGIMGIRKDILERYQGFSTALGMSGGKIAYGEELEFQQRLRRDGYEIAYDPQLLIYHVVAAQKLHVDWFFKAAFATGRDNLWAKNISRHPLNLLLIALVAIGQVLVYGLICTPKLWFVKEYQIENWLIDVFRKPAKRVGIIYTALLDKPGANTPVS